MNQRGQQKRKQHYIKKKFQRRFILQFSGLILVGCAAFSGALYIYSRRTLTTAFVDAKLQVMSTSDFLLPALGLTALIVSAGIAIFGALRLLLLSHQIAGPLYRLEKSADAVAEGNLDFKVRLRSSDELQDFAHSMDSMVSELRSRVQDIQKQSHHVRELLFEAQKNAEMPKELFDSIQKAQDGLDEAISRFQA